MTGRQNAMSDTEVAIMEATYDALLKHGYRNLTVQSIADEFDHSRGTVHYHFESKQALLVAFLEFLIDRFERHLSVDEDAPPQARLLALIDALLVGPDGSETDHWDLTTVMLEIRAEAPHVPEYQRQLTQNFSTVEARMIRCIEAGIEAGTFNPVDPAEMATTLLSAVMGARIYQVTLDRDDVAQTTRDGIVALIETDLLSGD